MIWKRRDIIDFATITHGAIMCRVFVRLSAAVIFAAILLASGNPAAGALERSAAAEYQLMANC
jgi:hypothetical protein